MVIAALTLADGTALAQGRVPGRTIAGEWQHVETRWNDGRPAQAGNDRWIIRYENQRYQFHWVGQSLTWRILLSDHNFFQWWIDIGNGGSTATCQLVDGGQALSCAGREFTYRYRRLR